MRRELGWEDRFGEGLVGSVMVEIRLVTLVCGAEYVG